MICEQCYTVNENDARFCKECGTSLISTTGNRFAMKRQHTIILLSYLGFHVLARVSFVILERLLMPTMIDSDPGKLTSIYWTTDLVLSVIDVLFMLLLVTVFKGKARIIALILFLLRITAFVVYFFF